MESIKRDRYKIRAGALFWRIMIRLCLPLFLLAAIFSAIQLTDQMGYMNKLLQLSIEMKVERIETKVSELLEQLPSAATESNLETLLLQTQSAMQTDALDVYSMAHKKIIGASSDVKWTDFDNQMIDESVYLHQRGKTFTAKVNKEMGMLAVYLPKRLQSTSNILIFRISFPLTTLQDAFRQSKKSFVFIIVSIIFIGFIIGQTLSSSIVKPILKLSRATQEIMNGNLGKQVEIKTKDEIESLANAFNRMSDQLREMKVKAVDSNPLTGLPGNQGIFHEINRRILQGDKFVMFHIDIDRFKIYNDHFGLAKGDMAIKKTVEILKRAVREKGTPRDFVGHQGGDDFILLTSPSHAEEIAKWICHMFSTDLISSLYPKTDVQNGYTMQVDRRRLAETGQEVLAKFPFIAISLAGVSNLKRSFADYFDCMGRATSVKKEVKKVMQSSYMIQE